MARGTGVADEHSPAAAPRYTYGALLALLLAPLGPVHPSMPLIAVVLALAICVITARASLWPGFRVAAFAAILALCSLVNLPYGIWTAVLLIVLASLRWRTLVPDNGWLPAGTMTRPAWWLAATTVVVAATALTIWAVTTSRFGTATEELVDALRDVPLVALIVGGIGFVLLNAVAEEVAYRRIAFDAAVAAMPPAAAIFAQGVAFGAAHIAGFPAGVLGVGLAAAYGTALGTLRYMTKGMWAPIWVHIAADTTIVALFIAVLLPE